MSQEYRPRTPRRRKRSQFEIFKENYLPAVIICIAFLLIVVFLIGSLATTIQRHNLAKLNDGSDYDAAQKAEYDRLAAEANRLMSEAAILANDFEYEQAIAILNSFSGNMQDFPELADRRREYASILESLVLWPDNSQVLNLSFQHLIVDPERAFQDPTYGTSYKQNFITVDEFTRILQHLYKNGYVLISMDDIVTEEKLESGEIRFSNKPLYLPIGKKPLIITQTQVNYYLYMTDGDNDGFPDKDGAGFANRLLIDENGNLASELIHADGSVSTGAYDLVPILESFITTHPDFSYRGARAILAVSGYDGLFGYRTTKAAEEFYGTVYHQEQIEQVSAVIEKLRDTGYDIACYTYENIAYGENDTNAIRADLDRWSEEVMPVLGNVDTFVFAKNSDISNTGTMYSGDKFQVLMNLGFRYYLGFCETGAPWQVLNDGYVRQGRLMVTGANIANNPQWWNGIFDATTVLGGARGTIPQ